MSTNNLLIETEQSEEYMEIYSNETDYNRHVSFVEYHNNTLIWTKAIDLWNHYKSITREDDRMKQKEFYMLINNLYRPPIKKRNVNYYPGIVIQPSKN